MAARKFFVGGNFKMNGSIKMIDSLVEQLNNAKLDGSTGSCFLLAAAARRLI
jgi:triosephosphate isomerase